MSCGCKKSDGNNSSGLNVCGESKKGCESFQSACHELFRATSPKPIGHLLVKGSPGDKCIGHMKPQEKALFVINASCGSGQELTDKVYVVLPDGRVAEKTSSGQVVRDDAGDIIYKPTKFKKLKVSDVDGADENLWMDIEAPKNSGVLVARDGYWEFIPNLASKVVSLETENELNARVAYTASSLSISEEQARIILGIDPTP